MYARNQTNCLPPSPFSKIKEGVQDAAGAAKGAADSALALVETDTDTIVSRVQGATHALAKVVEDNRGHIDRVVRDIRDVASQPDTLLVAAIALEAALMYRHVAPFHHYSVSESLKPL